VQASKYRIAEESSEDELQQDRVTHLQTPVKVVPLGRKHQMNEPMAGWVNPAFAPMPPADDTYNSTARPPRRLVRWDGVVHKVDLFAQFEAALSELPVNLGARAPCPSVGTEQVKCALQE